MKKGRIFIVLSVVFVLTMVPVYGSSEYTDIDSSHWARQHEQIRHN